MTTAETIQRIREVLEFMEREELELVSYQLEVRMRERCQPQSEKRPVSAGRNAATWGSGCGGESGSESGGGQGALAHEDMRRARAARMEEVGRMWRGEGEVKPFGVLGPSETLKLSSSEQVRQQVRQQLQLLQDAQTAFKEQLCREIVDAKPMWERTMKSALERVERAMVTKEGGQ